VIAVFVLAVPTVGVAQPARDPGAQLGVSVSEIEAGEFFAITARQCPSGTYRPVGTYRVEATITFVPTTSGPSRSYTEVVAVLPSGGDNYSALVAIPADAPTIGGHYEIGATCYFEDFTEHEWFTYDTETIVVSPPAQPVFRVSKTRLAAGESFDLTATTCPAIAAAGGGSDTSIEVVIRHDAPNGVAPQPLQTISVPGRNGLHEVTISIPTIAQTIGGYFDVATYCDSSEAALQSQPGYDDVRIRVAPESEPECDDRPATVDLSMLEEPTDFGDVIVGTAGDDRIDGGGGHDIICGLGGADRISGSAGNDLIYGGGGHDVIAGGAGADTIYGQYGGDTIHGGDDDDRLLGGPGFDSLHGDAGNDFIQGSGGDDEIDGGAGDDHLYGKAGTDHILGGPGNDEIFGSHGDDMAYGGDGRDRIQGASGNDMIEGGPGDDTIYGQADDDELFGDDGNDTIYAAAGDDLVIGGSGNDDLQGANGDDVIEGGDGDDVLYGQAGNDVIDGGADNDICYGGAAGESNRLINC